MHLGVSTRINPCSGGQCASFGIPYAYLNTTFQNLKFSKIQKRAWPFLYFLPIWRWLKVCFLSSMGQYASFGTPQAQCRTIFSKNSFLSNFAKFMHLGASTLTIPCLGGQYASFGTPHAYLKTKFQNLKFSKKSKKDVAVSACLPTFKILIVCDYDY